MIDELKAAREAAESYNPRNAGEEPHVLFIRALLDDAVLRAGMLDDLAKQHDDRMRIADAQQALNDAHAAAAQAPAPAPESVVGPDAQLTP